MLIYYVSASNGPEKAAGCIGSVSFCAPSFASFPRLGAGEGSGLCGTGTGLALFPPLAQFIRIAASCLRPLCLRAFVVEQPLT